MRGVALSLALLAAGCGGHSGVVGSSGNSSAGGIAGGGTLNISGQPNSTVSTLIGIGLLGSFVYGSEPPPGSYGLIYRANPFDAIHPRAPAAPELDASRNFNEQDCTKPIENWSANLKCR